MYPSFTVSGYTFYFYPIFMIVGAAVCIGIFVGLTYFRHRKRGAENGGKFIFGGATFYGGLLCALALWPILLLFWRRRTVSVYERLCDLAVAIPAGHFFGRIGCYFGGCCFGAPTNGPFGVVFPEGSAPYEFYGGPVAIHPTQLYEAAALLLIFAILFFFGKKNAFPLYLILYGVARFIIECFRADDRGGLFGLPLSPAQIISIVLILLGETILLVRAIRAYGGRPAGKTS